jgi:hypothetical protein
MKRFAYIKLLSVSCLNAIILAGIAVAELPVYEFSFWPGADAKFDKRVVRLSMHPCGEVAIARVTSIPPLGKERTLQPEKVVEFSPEGKVLRRWAIPVDTLPISIQDNRLLIQLASANPDRFWISMDGSIAAEKNQISTSKPNLTTCENLAKEFVNSAYKRCWRLSKYDIFTLVNLRFE